VGYVVEGFGAELARSKALKRVEPDSRESRPYRLL
jgi:hypothetical protein